MIIYTTLTIIFNITFNVIICNSITASSPIANTKYGSVEGISVPVHTGQIIDTYMGVPYARPPIGDMRFMKPEEPAPWDDILLAHEPGNACVQEVWTGVEITHYGWEKYDEDCLNLNIYTPQTNQSSLLPVLVFIHGGDFINGANFMYPGYFQAVHDVVVVQINYRLSILGFATTEDEMIPGNMGLFDQTLALRFIQENIEAFGGDPARVTISGESAGGASVGLHIVSTVSEGLFHGAILQSGSELDIWMLQPPGEHPSNYLEQVAVKVNCSTSSSVEMVDCLRTIDAQELVRTSHNLDCTTGYKCATFRPVVDGTFLTDLPEVLRKSGMYNRVPEMIGMNEDDGTLWFLGQDYEDGISREDFDALISWHVEKVAPRWPDPSKEEDAIQAVRFQYADWPYFSDPLKNRYMYSKMQGDLYYGHSHNLQAKIHSTDAPVYFYVWDYAEENNRYPDYYCTYHTSELAFTLGAVWIWSEENAASFNHSKFNPQPGYDYERTETDREVADFMSTLWTNFAKCGNPTPDPVGVDGSTEIIWPQFQTNNLTYGYLAYAPDVRMDYRQPEFAFWEHYFNYISYGETFELIEG